MKITTFRRAGFTLVEIMIVVAIIGLLAAMAIPNFIKARTTAQTNTCISNLHQIDAAIQQCALENGMQSSDAIGLTDITPYLGRGIGGSVDNLYCPVDPNTPKAFATSYTIVDCGTAPVCAIEGAAQGGSHVLN